MEPTTFLVEYDSNNSGGDWWLSDDDWRKLEEAGWTVEWLGLSFCHSEYGSFGKGGRPAPETCASDRDCPGHRGADTYAKALTFGSDARFLRAISTGATIEIEAYSPVLAEGVAALWWSETLGKDPDAEGCNCCGQPHNFYARPK